MATAPNARPAKVATTKTSTARSLGEKADLESVNEAVARPAISEVSSIGLYVSMCR
jgi:hypothetical protein